MKFDSPASVFNMGDTSIRVKQLVEINKIILRQLDEFMSSGIVWNSNKDAQENFYKDFIKEIVRIEQEDGVDLFSDFKREKSYSKPKKDKIGFRGRTLTNALVKSGLISSKRIISETGSNYLNGNLKANDPIEDFLSFSPDNLVYFRQYLKLRIYSSNSDKFFYNFRFALKFLSKNVNVPQSDFFTLLLSIRPEQSELDLNQLIEDYSNVKNGSISFNEFYTQKFTYALRSQEEILQVKDMFINNNFTDENFIKYFHNAKSSKTSLLYKKFVLAIISFKENQSIENFERLIKISKNNKIQKAFSFGKNPFINQKNDTPLTFLVTNEKNPLLSNDNFDIYLEFIFSKHRDLVREYSDMARRAFQVTGAISFENGLVNLNNRWLIEPLLTILGDRFLLTGSCSFTEYEENLNSAWFADINTMEILNINEQDYQLLVKNIAKDFEENDLSQIPNRIIEKRELEYREFVYDQFPKDKVIRILENISNRNDDIIFNMVTDNATVPTIYEYILTIAWFYLSENKNYYLHKSFGVSLDGNKLPLSHKGGGAGDIEIINNEYSLLIEGTLMDKNTQRRGELEPVIRHSINFTIDNSQNKATTIFIANELDSNVINIFRAAQFIQLNGTLYPSVEITGLNIFALTTNELIDILNKNISDLKIINNIHDRLDPEPIIIKNLWRESILEYIMSED